MRGFKVMGLNVRSLLPKIDNMKLDLMDGEIDVVSCTETWLHSDIPMSLINIVNYKCYRFDRAVKRNDGRKKRAGWGGICVYLKTGVDVDEHIYSRFNMSNSDGEIYCLKLTNGGSRAMVLISIYRPPNGKFKALYEKLHEIILELSKLHRTDVICLGDFNIDWLKRNDSRVNQLTALKRKCNLIQSVTMPTRVSATSTSLIDLLFQNVQNVSFTNIVSYALSDHNPIVLCKKATKRSCKSIKFKERAYRDFNSAVW